jgi:hypothetical protein
VRAGKKRGARCIGGGRGACSFHSSRRFVEKRRQTKKKGHARKIIKIMIRRFTRLQKGKQCPKREQLSVGE